MTPKEYPRKRFVWITLFLIAVVIVGTSLTMKAPPSSAITIFTNGQPTIGKEEAPIHIISFEEPKCPSCADFSKDIYPKLKKDFIDTGKVKYTLILVSFLPNSAPAAEAMYAVYDKNPANTELFYQYAEYIYTHQPNESTDWATTPLLLDFAAKTNSQIDQQKLRRAIEQQTYGRFIQSNTVYAQEVMGGSISTPRIYINGIEMKEMNYEMLADTLREMLKGGK